MKEIPRELDWVKARNACSLSVMFETLKKEVEEDINKSNELREGQMGKFTFHKKPNDFTVFWDAASSRELIVFYLKESTIEVESGDGKKILEVGITLNDAGECKFRVKDKDEELESWQFRKRVLEKFIFGPLSR